MHVPARGDPDAALGQSGEERENYSNHKDDLQVAGP